MKIVVTAGPTIEPIDDVRCLTNFSSGKTGYGIAEAARERGHSVVLISGPVRMSPPAGVRVVNVRTAIEMQQAIEAEFADSDALVMAAAVCDFRPAARHVGKLSRGSGALTLELVANPDIIASFGAKKGERVIMGFALESENGVSSARAKCERKNCDLVALNSPSVLDSDSTVITLVFRTGEVRPLPELPKGDAACLLVKEVEKLHAQSGQYGG